MKLKSIYTAQCPTCYRFLGSSPVCRWCDPAGYERARMTAASVAAGRAERVRRNVERLYEGAR